MVSYWIFFSRWIEWSFRKYHELNLLKYSANLEASCHNQKEILKKKIIASIHYLGKKIICMTITLATKKINVWSFGVLLELMVPAFACWSKLYSMVKCMPILFSSNITVLSSCLNQANVLLRAKWVMVRNKPFKPCAYIRHIPDIWISTPDHRHAWHVLDQISNSNNNWVILCVAEGYIRTSNISSSSNASAFVLNLWPSILVELKSLKI